METSKIGNTRDRQRKKSGELWSINNTALEVDSDPYRSTFSEDHISASGGCCRLKFLHALENDQCLLAHTHPTEDVGRAPWHFLTTKNIKNWLRKISVLAVITIGPAGVTSLLHVTCPEALPHQIVCVLEYDQGLLTHTPAGTGVPQQSLTMKI